MNKRLTMFGVLVLLSCAALAHASGAGPGVGADEALSLLKEGNARFVSGQMIHPRQDAARREQTAAGQNPFATVIGCSDSRDVVEQLFDQGVGDLFTIRVAGNPAHADVAGTAEYGAEHLGVHLLVVLGHAKCGAVVAAVASVAEGKKAGGNIDFLIAPILPAAAKAKHDFPELSGDALVEKAVTYNVWQSIDDLFRQSPILRGLVKEGKLTVVGAVYDIATGQVNWLGAHPEQARLLAYASGPDH
ncbi:MAG: carbonic anhydrase [Desulfovibrionaceae bacterium]|nr:carbonic anhydrase [Desulfovibrionaceae bacterium]